MGMSAGKGGDLNSEINVTPLVDVMLVLLIIFMVTAPMLQTGVDLELPQAEAAINRTLRQVAKGRTVIAVTHRLAPAATDRILVMRAGRLVEDGTHAELLALGGVYAGLWQAQQHSLAGDAFAG